MKIVSKSILQAKNVRFGIRRSSTAVRIGCASGFWGDTQTSSHQLVKYGDIDYLVSDYLSEITMSLLTSSKKKNPKLGYAPDFVHFAVGPLLKSIKAKNIKVITNAGGINPEACAEELIKFSKSLNVDIKVAVVKGDDMLPKLDILKNRNVVDINNNKKIPKTIMSMNAYFGAFPIKQALNEDVDVIITGRCVDSALVLGPLLHEFNWSFEDYDKLACGSLAGHLLECGAQSTGGIFTDWQEVLNWENIGFPIAECYENGNFFITKPKNTGGKVSVGTVAEQLVYEIDDPSAYLLPDVSCDFSNVKIRQSGIDRVEVVGVKGNPPTSNFKVCATYLDGMRCTAVFLLNGKNAIEKGYRTSESILKRVRKIFKSVGFNDFKRVNVQAIGDESLFDSSHRKKLPMRETMIWLAVEHDDKEALKLFTREIAAAGTGMAPGLCAFVGGRPKISPVLKLFSFLYPKAEIPAEVITINSIKSRKSFSVNHHLPKSSIQKANKCLKEANFDSIKTGNEKLCLEDLAWARSGDKGNNANIGVIARHSSFIPYIRHHLTSKSVFEYFRSLFDEDNRNQVTRYELPGIGGFNYVLKNCLGGGGVASLRTDPQGKSFAQMLLDIKIKDLPSEVVKTAAQIKSNKV